LLGLVAAVKATEVPGAEKRDREHAGAAGKHVACVPQFEVAHAADEDITDDEIEETPEYIDGRRRQPLASRMGERALKRPAHHAADEVRDRVRQEHAAEEVGHEQKRRHLRRSSSTADR